jgi:hypothetical protein
LHLLTEISFNPSFRFGAIMVQLAQTRTSIPVFNADFADSIAASRQNPLCSGHASYWHFLLYFQSA